MSPSLTAFKLRKRKAGCGLQELAWHSQLGFGVPWVNINISQTIYIRKGYSEVTVMDQDTQDHSVIMSEYRQNTNIIQTTKRLIMPVVG